MIMCVLLCYPVSIHMSQLQATGRPISSFGSYFISFEVCRNLKKILPTNGQFLLEKTELECIFSVRAHQLKCLK